MRCLEVYNSGNALMENDDKTHFYVDAACRVIWGMDKNNSPSAIRSHVGSFMSRRIDELQRELVDARTISLIWSSDLVQFVSDLGFSHDDYVSITGHGFTPSTIVTRGLVVIKLAKETIHLTDFRFGDTVLFIGWSNAGMAYWWKL